MGQPASKPRKSDADAMGRPNIPGRSGLSQYRMQSTCFTGKTYRPRRKLTTANLYSGSTVPAWPTFLQ
eukprot:scaffold143026_cov24-Prasinocladus_malaysianus.AAC.1